ncbi:RnfH family protein [Aestuariirhabdus sp. LZHN29]|uniref:RnfH family protein n=1 Tax=Aestuariirhabdus sp. LZHN29 TaxID=3417462 RepID=UPI003CF23AF2
MKISIAYAETRRQHWIQLELEAGATLNDAIVASGILERYPTIDLEQQRVGVFGKFAKLDTSLSDGDRVEIYRPIVADPKTVARRPQEVEA